MGSIKSEIPEESDSPEVEDHLKAPDYVDESLIQKRLSANAT